MLTKTLYKDVSPDKQPHGGIILNNTVRQGSFLSPVRDHIFLEIMQDTL